MAVLAAGAFWAPLAKTAAGRPVLAPTEVEIALQPDLELDGVRAGLIVTSHRLLWMAEGKERAGLLADVKAVKLESGSLFSSKRKLTLSLRSGITDPAGAACSLTVRHGGEDKLLSAIETCLERRAWEVAPAEGRRQSGFQTSGAGIAGIMRRQEKDIRATGRLATEAFTDLDALMGKARDVVAIMEKYKAQVEASEDDGARGAGVGAEESEDQQFRDLLLNMGISSPVTRSTAGGMYHQQLARQLVDFLSDHDRLHKAGGMMTLPDVYCIFNRARGLELISPDDLVEACKSLEPLGLPMSVRTFDSGVTVIQSHRHDDAMMAKRLEALAVEHNCLTSIQTASLLNIPLTLAIEHLTVGPRGVHPSPSSMAQPPSPPPCVCCPLPPQMAEQSGLLCRDESLEVLSFHPNKFTLYAAALTVP